MEDSIRENTPSVPAKPGKPLAVVGLSVALLIMIISLMVTPRKMADDDIAVPPVYKAAADKLYGYGGGEACVWCTKEIDSHTNVRRLSLASTPSEGWERIVIHLHHPYDPKSKAQERALLANYAARNAHALALNAEGNLRITGSDQW